jgi:hypothetical protein
MVGILPESDRINPSNPVACVENVNRAETDTPRTFGRTCIERENVRPRGVGSLCGVVARVVLLWCGLETIKLGGV